MKSKISFYTTSQLLQLIGVRGTSYINNVIFNARRNTPHPLAAAKIARGIWDKKIVDEYLASNPRRHVRKSPVR